MILWTAANDSYVQETVNFLTDMYSFFRVITRDTFGTSTKDVDLLMGDPIIKESMVLFVDDIIKRIKYSTDNVIVMEIEKFHYKEQNDTVLNTMMAQIKMLCC